LDNGYDELPITGEHAVALDNPPPIHKDQFDRILMVQSMVEDITLLNRGPAGWAIPGADPQGVTRTLAEDRDTPPARCPTRGAPLRPCDN
jgi:hypothetical protein